MNCSKIGFIKGVYALRSIDFFLTICSEKSRFTIIGGGQSGCEKEQEDTLMTYVLDKKHLLLQEENSELYERRDTNLQKLEKFL